MTGTLAAPPVDLLKPTPAEAPAPRSLLAAAAGLATVLAGALGIVLGSRAVFGADLDLRVGWLIPLSGLTFRLDGVGGLFEMVTGAVAVPVGVYAVGYARRAHLPRTASILLPVFVLTLLLVPAAGSVTTFLLAWEAMAVTSLVLVLSDHRRDEVRAAGVYYAVLTQLGFAAILLALVVLSAAGGADNLAALAAHIDRVSPAARGVVLVLTLLGFGSKAGLLPLHAWLPRAHPEAPSPVSALMSAAMVNLGIYGIVRFDLQLLAPAPAWWGLLLVIVGGLSALHGVLQASVATDLKRLLAYSTTENMGLIALALGASALLASAGAHRAAAIALAAALLHVMAHAAFKLLTFLAAGSVLAGTGLRDLDRLGGLAGRMRGTTVLFGIGALGACGLPLGAGFVSEWLIVQSLIHAPRSTTATVALAMPIALGTVALTVGLGVTAMVKAFGIGFLARPRSPEAARAQEASPTMLAGMAVGASYCAVLAVAPLVVAPVLRRVLAELPNGSEGPRLGALLRLPGGLGTIAPGWLAVGLAGAIAVVLGLSRWGARSRPAPARPPLWACGADGLTPRMQYTATSFAEPLQRVFDDVLRPDTDVEITHHAESRYLVERVRFRTRLSDAIEHRLYRPVLRALSVWAGLVRRAHSGSVHLYLAYGAVGLLIVLVTAR
jgi:hydrogenase-4 component B